MSEEKDVQQHEQTQRAEEYVIFPDHGQRGAESALFRKNKHYLVHEMNFPCFKCMMKADGEPPAEAYEKREVHHYLVEWAEFAAANPVRVQRALDHGFFDPYGFAAKMKGQPFQSPDDIRNLLVLCELHHRDPAIGIHHSTGPEWTSDMFTKEGVNILLTREEYRMLMSGTLMISEDGHLIKVEVAAVVKTEETVVITDQNK